MCKGLAMVILQRGQGPWTHTLKGILVLTSFSYVFWDWAPFWQKEFRLSLRDVGLLSSPIQSPVDLSFPWPLAKCSGMVLHQLNTSEKKCALLGFSLTLPSASLLRFIDWKGIDPRMVHMRCVAWRMPEKPSWRWDGGNRPGEKIMFSGILCSSRQQSLCQVHLGSCKSTTAFHI